MGFYSLKKRRTRDELKSIIQFLKEIHELSQRLIELETINVQHVLEDEALKKKMEDMDCHINSTTDLFCIEATDRNFQRMNPAWENPCGFASDRLMAKSYLDFVNPNELDVIQKMLTTLISQRDIINFAKCYNYKLNSWHWLKWSATQEGITI